MTAVSRRDLIHPFYEEQERKKNCFTKSLDIITDRVMGPVESSVKLTSTIKKIIDFVDGVIQSIGAGFKNFASGLGKFGDIADMLTCIPLLWCLAKDKFKDTLDKIGKIFIAIFASLMVVKTLEKFELFNLSSFVETFAKIPVIGLVVHIPVGFFSAIGYVFDTAYRFQQLINNVRVKKICKMALEHWRNKQQYFAERTAGRRPTASCVFRLYQEEKHVNELYQKLQNCKISIQKPTHTAVRDFIQGVDRLALSGLNRNEQKHRMWGNLNYTIKKWKHLVKSANFELAKAAVAMIVNITKIAMAVFTIIAGAGIAMFAATTPLMLILGAIFAIMNLAKLVFDIYAKDAVRLS